MVGEPPMGPLVCGREQPGNDPREVHPERLRPGPEVVTAAGNDVEAHVHVVLNGSALDRLFFGNVALVLAADGDHAFHTVAGVTTEPALGFVREPGLFGT